MPEPGDPSLEQECREVLLADPEVDVADELVRVLDRLPDGWTALRVQGFLLRRGDPALKRALARTRDDPRFRIRHDLFHVGRTEAHVRLLESLGLDYRYPDPAIPDEKRQHATNMVRFASGGAGGSPRSLLRVLVTALIPDLAPPDVPAHDVWKLRRSTKREIFERIQEILRPHFHRDDIARLRKTFDNSVQQMKTDGDR